jgi:hypothetical protein
VAAWIEFLLLERWLSGRIGKVPIPVKLGLGALGAAAVAGALAFGVGRLAGALHAPAFASSIAAIAVFGAAYLALMYAAKVPETRSLLRRIRR